MYPQLLLLAGLAASVPLPQVTNEEWWLPGRKFASFSSITIFQLLPYFSLVCLLSNNISADTVCETNKLTLHSNISIIHYGISPDTVFVILTSGKCLQYFSSHCLLDYVIFSDNVYFIISFHLALFGYIWDFQLALFVTLQYFIYPTGCPRKNFLLVFGLLYCLLDFSDPLIHTEKFLYSK